MAHKMAALLLTLGLLLVKDTLGQSCGQINVNGGVGRILNGAPAFACAIPWHVQIHFFPDNTALPLTLTQSTMTCGGVIIDQQYVKISPTCMFLYSTTVAGILSTMVVVAGDNDITVFPETSFLGTQQEQIRIPTEIYFQNEYTIRSQADLFRILNEQAGDFKVYRDYQCGIVKLDQPFVLNACVNSICLPEPGDSDCSFKNCLFSGNGLITTDLTQTPVRDTRLNVAALTALPSTTCPVLEQMGYSLPTAGGLCAKTESVGVPCINDNGGALACLRNGTYFLRGTSVPDFCDGAAASLFADSSLCLDFITQTLAGLSTPAV